MFDGGHDRRRRGVSAFAVGEVGDCVSLVERPTSWLGLRQQVARVVEAQIGRALLASDRTLLALAAYGHEHTRHSISIYYASAPNRRGQ